MIKAKLIDRIAIANPHLRRSDAERTVETAILEEISAALARGDRVELRGVGAFTVRVRRGRPSQKSKERGSKVRCRRNVFPFSSRANQCTIA